MTMDTAEKECLPWGCSIPLGLCYKIVTIIKYTYNACEDYKGRLSQWTQGLMCTLGRTIIFNLLKPCMSKQ